MKKAIPTLVFLAQQELLKVQSKIRIIDSLLDISEEFPGSFSLKKMELFFEERKKLLDEEKTLAVRPKNLEMAISYVERIERGQSRMEKLKEEHDRLSEKIKSQKSIKQRRLLLAQSHGLMYGRAKERVSILSTEAKLSKLCGLHFNQRGFDKVSEELKIAKRECDDIRDRMR